MPRVQWQGAERGESRYRRRSTQVSELGLSAILLHRCCELACGVGYDGGERRQQAALAPAPPVERVPPVMLTGVLLSLPARQRPLTQSQQLFCQPGASAGCGVAPPCPIFARSIHVGVGGGGCGALSSVNAAVQETSFVGLRRICTPCQAGCVATCSDSTGGRV